MSKKLELGNVTLGSKTLVKIEGDRNKIGKLWKEYKELPDSAFPMGYMPEVPFRNNYSSFMNVLGNNTENWFVEYENVDGELDISYVFQDEYVSYSEVKGRSRILYCFSSMRSAFIEIIFENYFDQNEDVSVEFFSIDRDRWVTYYDGDSEDRLLEEKEIGTLDFRLEDGDLEIDDLLLDSSDSWFDFLPNYNSFIKKYVVRGDGKECVSLIESSYLGLEIHSWNRTIDFVSLEDRGM